MLKIESADGGRRGQPRPSPITAESPLIDVKQNAAAATISREVIDRIPKGRDWTSVMATAPGANSESRAGGFQIDGSSGSENRFIVDGMDRTNLRTGTSDAQNGNATVLVDFLEQVQVKSSGYAAEYGGATGGVISAITKSGSNQFRGSLGTYYRNNDMQSAPRAGWRINPFSDCATCTGVPEFLSTPDTSFDNWNPLGDLGGPVLQDRLLVLFRRQLQPDRQPADDDLQELSGAVRDEGHDQLERRQLLQLERDDAAVAATCGCG